MKMDTRSPATRKPTKTLDKMSGDKRNKPSETKAVASSSNEKRLEA